jgi:hypothetical protein
MKNINTIRFGFYPDYDHWLFIEYGYEGTEETFENDFEYFHGRIGEVGVEEANRELQKTWSGKLVSSAEVERW